jgi:uncharacterized membrane protein
MSAPADRSRVLALCLLVFGACGVEPPPAEIPDEAPVPAETPAATPEEAEGAGGPADLPDLVFIALGNEPFWNVRVFRDRLRYEGLGEDPVEFESPRDVTEPGNGRWEWTAEAGAQTISVTIEERPCSDTMSDVSYRYASSVRFGERSLVGCALMGGAAEPD